MELNNAEGFESRSIRRAEKDGKIYFSVVDFIWALTNSDDAKDYWYRLKQREFQLSTFCRQLKLRSGDGKLYMTDVASIEGLLRIVQSVPSPKAQPAKAWLARIGTERIEERHDPELGISRARGRAVESWRNTGHTNEWIASRIKSIDQRNVLTDVFKELGLQANQYGKHTAITHQAAFGLKPAGHKDLKKLPPKASLRENMMGAELTIIELAERVFADMLKEGASLDEAQRKQRVFSEGVRNNYRQVFGKEVATPDNTIEATSIKGGSL